MRSPIDPIAVHLIETTASAGAKFSDTPMGRATPRILGNFRLVRETHLILRATRRKLSMTQNIIEKGRVAIDEHAS